MGPETEKGPGTRDWDTLPERKRDEKLGRDLGPETGVPSQKDIGSEAGNGHGTRRWGTPWCLQTLFSL